MFWFQDNRMDQNTNVCIMFKTSVAWPIMRQRRLPLTTLYWMSESIIDPPWYLYNARLDMLLIG